MSIHLPPIPDAERTPLILQLLEIIQQQSETIQQLKDEIARLKGDKTRPTILPSTLENPKDKPKDNPVAKKRPGSDKRAKTENLPIHEEIRITPPNLPAGSTLKDVQHFVVQDLVIKPHNTCYLLERWQTPDGSFLVAELPANVRAGGHFGPTLKSTILYQHHSQQVTQPRILTWLHELGVDISSGQVNRVLSENHEPLHAEKKALLTVGLTVSSHVNVDDTAARHKGKNGYATHIGNEYFAWFASTESKSRINFLELLRGGATDYHVSEEALSWMREQKLPQAVQELLQQAPARVFANETLWNQHLKDLAIVDERHCRIATEGALLGSVLAQGMNPNLVIVSDDAGQFDIWLHALCWVHAERNLHKLVPLCDKQKADQEAVLTELWQLYKDLKVYKIEPQPTQKAVLAARFDALCDKKTSFAMLNQALKRLKANKTELLLVLERPEIPLHNNLSEQDIRDYVTKRKVSGGTRSDLGRRCRDTFMSLKKTCGKLGVSFWNFLKDRLMGLKQIPMLGELVRERAETATS